MRGVQCCGLLLVLSTAGIAQTVVETTPALNQQQAASVGDAMLTQRTGAYQDCVTPKLDFDRKLVAAHFIIKYGVPLCKANPKNSYYRAPYPNAVQVNRVGTTEANWKVFLKEADGERKLCLASYCTEAKSVDEIVVGPAFVEAQGSITRKLIYTGHSGSIVKLEYQKSQNGETSNSRDLEIDLKDGHGVTVRGAEMVIDSADGNGLSYRVNKYFSD